MSYRTLVGDSHAEKFKLIEISLEQQDRARRYVASAATDVEDCRLLLGALGILPAAESEACS